MGGKHKKCKNEGGCGLIASFGFNKTIGTEFCSKHKTEGMINLLCKLCSCGKARPTYNLPGIPANYCKECKTDEMVNVNDKKCFCGRVKPTFNYPGEKSAIYCTKCKLEGMVDIRSNPCKCGKSTNAGFNIPGLKPEYCSSCKTPDMIDIYRKLCHCKKRQPSFNYDKLSPEYCKSCKLPGMIDLKTKKCIECKIYSANFNYENEKPLYCSKCKKDEMYNNSYLCKNTGCKMYGNVKYKYYCTHCFTNMFPSDPLVLQVHKKSKENYVRDFLNEYFDGFVHDHPLWIGECDCSHRRRIDHRKLIGNTLLCIETDEKQHKRYDVEDEKIRYDDLYMVHGGKFIFIRFNPDSYTNNFNDRVNPNIKHRMDDLMTEIEKHIERINNDDNSELLEVHYLFYDGYR
jgi:hypothetical protein